MKPLSERTFCCAVSGEGSETGVCTAGAQKGTGTGKDTLAAAGAEGGTGTAGNCETVIVAAGDEVTVTACRAAGALKHRTRRPALG